MSEQFNYRSILAPFIRQLLELKTSAGIAAHRVKWILKEIDDFAVAESLQNPHITEAFIGPNPLVKTTPFRARL